MRIRRGEVYWLKPDATGKQRPVVIISREDLNGGHSLVGVPFYSQQLEKRTQQAWCVFFAAGEGGLTKDCVAKTDEVSMIDKLDVDLQRGPLGIFDAAQMQKLVTGLKWSLEIP